MQPSRDPADPLTARSNSEPHLRAAADPPPPPARTAPSPPQEPAAQAPPELAEILLPGETVTFSSTPHPIMLIGPLVGIAVVAIAIAVALAWQTHPIVRGHHVARLLLAGPPRTLALIVGGLLLLRELLAFLQRLMHVLSYRIVTTNRRVFLVEGLFGRRVRPFGNTALAASRLSQGVLGRLLGYGTIYVGAESADLTYGGAVRDMRDPVKLYREFEEVAMGVDGDTWRPAIRQTIVP